MKAMINTIQRGMAHLLLLGFPLLSACGGGGGGVELPAPVTPSLAPNAVYTAALASAGSLTATNTVRVSWQKSNEASIRYELVRTSQQNCSLVAAESCTDFKRFLTLDTTVDDTNLPWGKVYYYYLRLGRTVNGNISGYSPASAVSVPVIAPRALGISMSGTTALLNWDSLPEVEYTVLMSKQASCNTGNISSCTGGSSVDKSAAASHTQPLLDVGSTYYFWVNAKRGDFTDTSLALGQQFIAPFSPSTFSVVQNGRDFDLAWDKDRNSTYTVWRWSNCSVEPDLTAATSSANAVESLCTKDKEYTNASDPFKDTDVSPGVPYYYAVQAHAGGQSASRSGVKKAILKAALPVDFSVTVHGYSSSVFFTRDTEFAGIQYQLYRAANRDCHVSQPSTCQEFQTYTNITAGHVDQGLKGNRQYYYWLEASIGVAAATNLLEPEMVQTNSIVLKANAARSFAAVNEGKCIQESVSGLAWAKLDAADAVVGGLLPDPDDTFEHSPSLDSNRNANKCGTGTSSVTAGSCTTGDAVKRFNDAQICGRSNWRLPTLLEMLTLIDFQNQEVNKTAFYTAITPSLTTFKYWVSDENSAGTAAIAVNENGGAFTSENTTEKLHLRLVSPGVQ